MNNSKDYSEQDGCSESFLFDSSLLIHQSGFSYEAPFVRQRNNTALKRKEKKSKKVKHNLVKLQRPVSAGKEGKVNVESKREREKVSKD